MNLFKITIIFALHFVAGQITAPRLNITIRTDNKDEFEVGTPRVLACIIVGCAPSLNVIWYLGDTMLRPNVYKEVKRGNFTVSSLTFVPSLTDNGKELVCRATNGDLSQIFEDRVTISVGQRPRCIDSTYKTVKAVEGESQTLTCVVQSDPDPEQFVWSFPGGRTIFTSSKKVPGHESRYSSALVWVPQRDDYGPVHCRAVNRFGDQKQPCTFSVVNGVPKSPDCDFHWESQEINDPCGKNKYEHGPIPTVWKNSVFDEIHPEDATPIDPFISEARYPLWLTLGAVVVVVTLLCGCLAAYKSRCTSSDRQENENNNNMGLDFELDEIVINDLFQEAGGPEPIMNHACRLNSRTLCDDHSTPYHKHEYCV